jgi:hypothetical protein
MGDEQQLAALAERLQALEDLVQIYQLVATYGPSIDGGAAEEAGRLWTEDCWYDSDAPSAGSDGVRGRSGIEQVSRRCHDLTFGVAHITHLPVVTVEGNRAVVIGHSNTFHQDGPQFAVGRVASNRWELERIDGAWQVRRRVNRLLDGSPESKDVFRGGLQEAASKRD